MALVDQLAVFLVGLIVGGTGIYAGARAITGSRDYRHAIITALVGSIIWAILGLVPVIGPLLALFGWIWVINWRYRGGWGNAILIGLIAWIATLLILYILASFGLTEFGAIGVPAG